MVYWSAAETQLTKLDRVLQQAQRLFGWVAVPPLEQGREAAAIGTNMPAYVRKSDNLPLKPLTPEDQLRRSIRLKGAIQQHKHQLQGQTTTKYMYLKGVTEVESSVFGTDWSQNV